ncbi:EAL domain-containing protein, partial [Oceanospirillum sp. HFRX-1_2]
MLYRNNATTSNASVSSPHEATARVCTVAFMDIGIDRLADKHPVFINMTDEWLLKGDMLPEPAERIVLEVLEDIKPTPEVLASLKSLRARGYKIALDDFVLTQETKAFLPYADLIKLDVMACSIDVLEKRVSILKRLNVPLLAEKVETWDEFEACKAMGFTLFQGYFLSKPE